MTDIEEMSTGDVVRHLMTRKDFVKASEGWTNKIADVQDGTDGWYGVGVHPTVKIEMLYNRDEMFDIVKGIWKREREDAEIQCKIDQSHWEYQMKYAEEREAKREAERQAALNDLPWYKAIFAKV